MKLLRVGVIGAGFIGRQHIEAVRRIPGTEVVAIVDNNEENARATAEQMAVPTAYTDYRRMLEQEKPDIVHNCTPNGLHFSINRDIIQSGIHVFSEKPLTLTVAEAHTLCKLVKQHDVAAAVNFNYRNNVMVHEMRRRVQDGEIGRVLECHGNYLQDWLLYKTDYDWRMDPVIGGESRAVADIGSHIFDVAQYVTGKQITEVYAKLFTVYPKRIRTSDKQETFTLGEGEEIPIHSEDAAYIMARFDDGTYGNFNVSQVCAGKKNGLEVTVSGSEAALEWHQERADHLWVGHRDKGNEDIFAAPQYVGEYARKYATLPNGHPVGWTDALRNGIAAFYDSIRGDNFNQNNQMYATFKDGCKIMEIVEACLESNRREAWVHVGG